MNATHEISPIRQRPFLAGFWLMAAIPAYIPILGLLMQVFNLEFESPPARFLFFLWHLAAGYLWARSLGFRSGLPDNKLMNISGGIGFALGVVGLIGGLSEFAPILIDPWLGKFKGVGNLEFGALFAPWTGLVCGISGFALGIGLKNLKLSLKLLALGFITGLGLYLAIMFTMQLLGFKVGSGRPVMIPTTFLSIWVTALVGSELFGRVLSASNERSSHAQI
jgi:hypothetical protein